ncbi:hypothetical protein ACGFYQ_30045 [Streptomyces sp. NPDC048258]|uniref:hypothetical protein n=1 Tax=Streptomyces sp. NPDC048258 TaxID=3365527 RepID=UPI00371DB119
MSDDDYSATVLGSHWISGPPERADVAPDRVDGSVLRFGPGVTAAAVAPFPVVPGPAVARRRGGLRRYALAAAVLVAVLACLGWQRYGPGIAVRDVAVTTDPAGPACGGAADVVAVVRTNGRPGTLTYRWIRSDGTRSETLTERVPRGRQEASLHLLWTFQGAGNYPAKAQLELMEPTRRTSAAAEFTYRCAP